MPSAINNGEGGSPLMSNITDRRETLKPCPFCGGNPALETRDVEPQGDPWYGKKNETFVLCECGACLFDGMFHEGFCDPETRAVAAWNTRADSSQ
jgi:hypothetical protein